MPKDAWGRERNKLVARRVRFEFATGQSPSYEFLSQEVKPLDQINPSRQGVKPPTDIVATPSNIQNASSPATKPVERKPATKIKAPSESRPSVNPTPPIRQVGGNHQVTNLPKPSGMTEPPRKTHESDDEFLLRRSGILASYLRQQARYLEAEPHLRNALQLAQKLFPPDHERVAVGLETYAAILRLLRRDEEARPYKSRAEVIRANLRSSIRPSTHQPLRQAAATTALAKTHPVVPGRCPTGPAIVEDDSGSTSGTRRGEDLLHFKSAVLRLEEYLLWEALCSGWKDRRESWVLEVSTAMGVRSLARLVSELEEHVSTQYTEEGWDEEREAWATRCKSSLDNDDLVERLIELEDHIEFRAFQEEWLQDRVIWGRMVEWLYSK